MTRKKTTLDTQRQAGGAVGVKHAKITYIGGGSRLWAHMLMKDLALCDDLQGDLVLYDIDQKAAENNVKVAKAIFSHPDSKTKFTCQSISDLGEALKGADFVVASIEPGPIEARAADLLIPQKYGVLQTVGDTSGPGGLLRALRAMPVYMDFARAIETHCPDAWVINYTNPMTLCTGALYAAAPNIKAFGCCHEVFGTQKYLAKKVADWFKVEAPNRDEIILDITGVNHFTWATSATWDGHDLLAILKKEMDEKGYLEDRDMSIQDRLEKELYFSASKIVARDLFHHFGALGAAGDRHLVEFVPYYLQNQEVLHRYDVVQTPYEWRLKDAKQRLANGGNIDLGEHLKHSGEEGVAQIRALLGLGTLRTNVNLPNHGQVRECAPGAIVESYALMSRNRIETITAGAAPDSVGRLVNRVSALQESVIRAVVNEDSQAIFQALLTDPLMSKLTPSTAQKMWNEMLEAVREHIPVWMF